MYQRYRQLIPVFVLSILFLSTLLAAVRGTIELDNVTYGFAPTIKHYGAFVAIVTLFSSFFWQRKYYNYALLLTFLLLTFNLINSNASEISIGLAIGELGIKLNPFGLLFGLITYALNYQTISPLLLRLIKPSEAKIAYAQNKEIIEFKERFTRKSSDELAQIVADNKLIPVAVIAAQQLLQERQVTKAA
jgi:hypothetical protein